MVEEPFEPGDYIKRILAPAYVKTYLEKESWKDRAELAERKLAILTQTIHEAWNKTKEQGG